MQSGLKEETEPLVDYVTKFLKSSVFNEPIEKPNDIIKIAMEIKNVVSMAVLGGNLLSGLKETVNGFIFHYTRSLSHSLFNKDKVGLKDITKAYGIVWKDVLTQPSLITLIEKMNNRFGLSNHDIPSMVKNMNYYKTDMFRMKWLMYWANRAPDYLNRMTLLIGYMLKDGIYSAYHVNENDELVYNWR
jgi:hypothetical protein